MPNCDFYALAADLGALFDFIFEQPGWQLWELTSPGEQPLRSFATTGELRAAFPSVVKVTAAHHFHLYAPEMGGSVTHRRIELPPGAVPGATFRYASEGWGLIQLYTGALRDAHLSACHTNHNSERRALTWATHSPTFAPPSVWNWSAVGRISGRLNRFIRGIAAGKRASRPILPAAFDAFDAGALKLVQHR